MVGQFCKPIDNEPDEVAWFEDNIDSLDFDSGIFKPVFVGKKKPNDLGIYDMSGNVSELCNDFYEETYYTHCPQINPCNSDKDFRRVVRGGNSRSKKDELRCSKRIGQLAIHIGFRLAISAKLLDDGTPA